jgi:hypothetical protein
MSSEETTRGHEDLYAEIMESANKTGEFVVETDEEHPDLTFEVSPADKPTRNKLRRAMPEGLLDGIELPDDVDDVDEISVDDVDLSGVSIKDMTFGMESTETWLDEIVEHFDHGYFSDSEIRNIFNAVDDDIFISAGSYTIELGEASGPVTGFRKGQ